MAAISKWTVPKHLCHIEFSPGHGGCFAVWLPFFFLHELIKKYENWQHCAKCHWELMAKGKKLLECLLVLVRIVHRSYMGEGARGGDQDVEVPREFCQFVQGYISESLHKGWKGQFFHVGVSCHQPGWRGPRSAIKQSVFSVQPMYICVVKRVFFLFEVQVDISVLTWTVCPSIFWHVSIQQLLCLSHSVVYRTSVMR